MKKKFKTWKIAVYQRANRFANMFICYKASEVMIILFVCMAHALIWANATTVPCISCILLRLFLSTRNGNHDMCRFNYNVESPVTD